LVAHLTCRASPAGFNTDIANVHLAFAAMPARIIVGQVESLICAMPTPFIRPANDNLALRLNSRDVPAFCPCHRQPPTRHVGRLSGLWLPCGVLARRLTAR